MLVLYGGPGLSDYTEGLVPLLGSACSLVRYTQRGVKPSVADGPFTVDQHVEDAARVLDAMDAGRVWVLGHSWGGYLAMQLALAQQHRLAGLVLGAPWVESETAVPPRSGRHCSPAHRPRWPSRSSRSSSGQSGVRPPITEVIEAHTLLWPAYFADPALASELPPIEMSTRCFAETSESIESQQATGALERALPGLAMPVVLVHGRQDTDPDLGGRGDGCADPGRAARADRRLRPFPVAGAAGSVREAGCGVRDVLLARVTPQVVESRAWRPTTPSGSRRPPR